MVGRQVQRRRARQLLGPVGERRGVVAALGLADVVEVAEFERRQGRGFARRVRRVELGELGQQHFERPAVAGDVVQHEAEQVVVGGEPDEGEPQHRAVFEVEGAVGALGQERPGVFRVRPAGQVDPFESRSARADRLDRPAVALGEGAAQHVVPVGELGQRPVEELDVQGAVDAQRDRQVVRDVGRVELVQEPEPFLGRAERGRVGRVGRRGEGGGGRGPGGGRAVPAAGGRDVRGPAPGYERGRPGDGRVLEEAAERHLGAQFGAHPGDDPRGQQGVAAEFEKAGLRVDRVGAEHIAPDARDGGGQLARRGALRQLGIHRLTRPTSGPADR